jgi:tetratricopeptide (TPR) repeat protein
MRLFSSSIPLILLLVFSTASPAPAAVAPECNYTQETRVLLQYILTGEPGSERSCSDSELLSQARQQYLDGKLRSAFGLYSRILAVDPDHADALRGRGLVELRVGDYEAAIRDLAAAESQLGPYREQKFPGIVGSTGYLEWRKAQGIYEEGNDYLANKEYDNAIKKYGEALHVFRRYPQCLHNLAIAFGKSGQYRAAEIVCMEAISLRYSDWKFWKTLSIELYMQNKFHVAMSAMQQAMHLGPPEPEQAELIEDLEIVKDQLRKRRGFFS